MSRTYHLLLIVWILGIPCFIHAAEQPNVVLIPADDLNWSDVGYQGSAFHETPNLDALTKQGMVWHWKVVKLAEAFIVRWPPTQHGRTLLSSTLMTWVRVCGTSRTGKYWQASFRKSGRDSFHERLCCFTSLFRAEVSGMLTIYGKSAASRRGFCDRVARRDFLTIGGMALGGISLQHTLRAESEANVPRSHKAIINIYLPGGPPHLDMWDPKPEAPAEIRGEFSTIATNVPGIFISELFPRMAAMMDKFVLVRSLADSDGAHDAYQCMTGRRKGSRQPPGGWPSGGAWVSKMEGQVTPAIPANVALMYQTGHRSWGEAGSGGFLGVAHAPFNLVGREARSKPDNMLLNGVTLERLQDRTRLMQSLDQFRRNTDQRGQAESLDVYTQQAMGILTTSRLADALDLSKEDPRVLARYGESSETFQRDGAPPMVENLCLARRLVEAGARFVSLNFSRWDWHGPDGMNFPKCREESPRLDQGLAALVTDLHERGLDRDVSIVVWGEFGRTPKINGHNSRDHWPQANTAVLAGGGMRTGQVIGSTNRYGEQPQLRPVQFQEVFATLYKCAGIDAQNTRIFDLSGVPQYLVDPGNRPLHDLV